MNEKTLAVIISQSGETADTLAALREAKRLGARVLAIVNVVGSSIAREADDVLYTWAGPEIAVATTKAYNTQLSAMYMLGLYLAQARGTVEPARLAEMCGSLSRLGGIVETALEKHDELQYLASQHFNAHDVFFIGRGLDYASSMEGSLKLKEISYIHSEAYAAGELKHGTISLIEPGTLVVAIATQRELLEKTLNSVHEVKARGAFVLALTQEGFEGVDSEADYVIRIPRVEECFAPSVTAVPMQLLAYYIAVQRGCDVDHPRNLAKSVTVE